jgi:sugar lactone lactonase YvrE
VIKHDRVRAATSVALCSLTLMSALGLAGCGMVLSSPSNAVESAAITGMVHGGQQPVSGATVQLIAPGTTGYGSAGTVIASTTTNGGGVFTLPHPLTCPANSGLVYLLATGGNAGGGTNTAIGEAAIVGPCSGISTSTFISITEVTTVAAAYVLAPFASVPASDTNIGTSATNLQGLTNAAGAAGNLASTATGFAHTTSDLNGIVPPTAEINTLADILSSCVNQGTSTATTGTCATLFAAAAPSGGTMPTDTFQAALDIAQNPANNPTGLFALATASPPFQPTLTTAPTDFSIALGYNGGSISFGQGTVGVAIDAAGNAWITGYQNPTLTEISPAGVYLSGSTAAASTGFGTSSLNYPIGLAIDEAGAIWVDSNASNGGNGDVQKFNPNGTLQATYTANSFAGTNGIAIDGSGDAWVTNFGSDAITELLASGAESTNSPFTYAYLAGGTEAAIDPKAVWVANYDEYGDVGRIDLSTFAVSNFEIGGSNGGVAIDHSNNVYIVNTYFGVIVELNDAGTFLNPPDGYYGGDPTNPQNVTIDGLGNIFSGSYTGTSNGLPGTLLEFSSTGTLISPLNGYTASNVIPVAPQVADSISVDGSGNLWMAGTNNGSTAPNYVAEVIGIAAPVVTPKSVATANNTIGVRP